MNRQKRSSALEVRIVVTLWKEVTGGFFRGWGWHILFLDLGAFRVQLVKIYTLLKYIYDLSTFSYISTERLRKIWLNYCKVKEPRPQNHWNGYHPLLVRAGSVKVKEGEPSGVLCWALCWVLSICPLVWFLQLLFEVGSMPILQMAKPQFRELELLVQGHRAIESHSQDLNTGWR